MSIAGPTNPYGGSAALVDRYIGNAYRVVRDVQAHLLQIAYLADNLTELRPREVEFRPNDTTQSIEWKYTDGTDWQVLVPYASFYAYLEEQTLPILAEMNDILATMNSYKESFDTNILNGQVLSLPSVITEDVVVAEGYNAMSIGPVTLAPGVVFVVPEDSTYTVV